MVEWKGTGKERERNERKGKKKRGTGGMEEKGGDPKGWFTAPMFEILKIPCIMPNRYQI